MSTSAGFRIPFARAASGELVAPEDARRGTRYECPACEASVDLHAGEIKRRHFHHRTSVCSAETVLHVTAKALIVRAVTEWRAGGPDVIFSRGCAEAGCEAKRRMTIPRKVRRGVEEWTLRSGHVVDVALLGVADVPVAAIEVRVTHEVPDEKARELAAPWIEVDGESVCTSAGRELVPVRDRFVPWLCSEHEHRRGAAHREKRAAVRLENKLLRELGYAPSEYPGYRIAGVARCRNGHDTLVLAWSGKQAPWPRPPHVVTFEAEKDVLFDRASAQVRRVLPFRRSWSSVCTTCGLRVVMGEPR